jgi:cell division protein FtsA
MIKSIRTPKRNGLMMVKKLERNIITGLDIGTSKVVALVGEVAADGTIEIIGIGKHPSRGLKRGVVVDIEATVGLVDAPFVPAAT